MRTHSVGIEQLPGVTGIMIGAGFGHGPIPASTEIGDENRCGPEIAAGDDRYRVDARDRGDHRLHLAGFHALTPDLDLLIGSSQILQFTVGSPSDQIPGAVHPGTHVPPRIGREPARCQSRRTDVARCQLRPHQIQLAGDPDRNRTESAVEDPHLGPRYRVSDRNDGTIRRDPLGGHVDRRLGRPVQIHQSGTGGRPYAPGEPGRQRLARREHPSHVIG